MKELKKLIALTNFGLGIADRHKWAIPNQDKRYPRNVAKGTIFEVGNSPEEQYDANYLVYCKAAGDASDAATVQRVEEEIKAEANPAVVKEREILYEMMAEHEQEARRARGELKKTAGKLRTTEDDLGKAQEAAGRTLREALEMWNRLDLPEVEPATRAMIMDAVRMYMSKPEKRSLSKVAAEFRVTKQRVSQWFQMFTKATGVKVVTHQRHESVREHIRAERQGKHGEEAEPVGE
jgi:hypothetical protein